MKFLKVLTVLSISLLFVACGSDSNDSSEYSATVTCDFSGVETVYEFDSEGFSKMTLNGEEVDLSDYGYDSIDLGGVSVEEYVNTFVETLEAVDQKCEVK